MPRAVIASGLPGSEPFPVAVATIGANVAETALHHLVTVQRNTEAGVDDWGQPLPPDWDDYLVDLACLGFVRTARAEQGREIVDTAKSAVIEDRRVLVALGTDVTVADRLSSVTDADGGVVLAGPLAIHSIDRRVSYLELAVEAVS